MANLWRAVAPLVDYSSSVGTKSMIDVSNGSASRVVRVYRMFHFAWTSEGPVSIAILMVIGRLSGVASGGQTIYPKAPRTSMTLSAGITAGSARLYKEVGILRQYMRSTKMFDSDSPAEMSEFQMDVPMSVVWDAGYCDTNIQPITLRTNEGVHIRQWGGTGGFSSDYEIEFTDEGA